MPYTLDQLRLETAEYKLTDQELGLLTNSLNIPGAEPLLQQKQISISNLIYSTDDHRNFILSEEDAKQIVNAFDCLKSTEVFKANKLKLDSLVFWVKTGTPYIKVIHTDTIKKLSNLFLPALFELPNQYNKAILSYPEFTDIEKKLDELITANHTVRRKLAINLIEQHGIKKIDDYLVFLEKNPILLLSKNQYDMAIGKYLRLCGLTLRTQAAEFFTDILKKQGKTPLNFTYSFKQTGIQYGIILKAEYQTDDGKKHQIKYFIKSHQAGHYFSSYRRHSNSSNDEVDLKELFVYKALEALKLGPKSYFFTVNDPDIGGLYIGTQDLGFSKKYPPSAKLFKTYDQHIKSLQAAESKSTEETKKGVIKLDAFARIFHLVDLNQGNFGQITITNKTDNTEEIVKEKWKLIDFRTPTYGSYQYPDMDMINGFLAGNGTQSYEKSFKDILLSGSKTERLQTLLVILNQYKTEFQQQIEAAYQVVIEIANKNYNKISESGNIASLIEDLKKYKDAINSNFNQFLGEANHKVTEFNNSSQHKI